MTPAFSFAATFTDINTDLWAYLFNVDPIALTDPELHARLTCEGTLA